LPAECGAVVFLLADQPQITSTLIHALVGEHARALPAIVAPLVGGQRANPVCFDKITFSDLLGIKGEMGGRALFSQYQVAWLPWHDRMILEDVDTEADYQRILGI
jgi:molybdenum cofactor cytidylyltransferase